MRRVTASARSRAGAPRGKAKLRRDPRSLRRQRLQRYALIGAALATIAGTSWMLWPSAWIERQGVALGDGLVALSVTLALPRLRVAV
jgi:hypothetical protein